MSTILISLISDQTIPNLLLIKELEGRYDQLVFISTPAMELGGKSGWIEEAAGIEKGSVPRIIVEENNWTDIREKLQSFSWPNDARFIVNQTGGTKVMTLSVFEFFSFKNSRIVYAPIGKNQIEELFPLHTQKPQEIKYRLNLKEYLLAHGLYFQSANELLVDEEFTSEFFEYFKSRKFRFYHT